MKRTILLTMFAALCLAASGARCRYVEKGKGRCVGTAVNGEPYCTKHHPIYSQEKQMSKKRKRSKMEKIAIASLATQGADQSEQFKSQEEREAERSLGAAGLVLLKAEEDLRVATEARVKAEKNATENKNPRWQKRLNEILEAARRKESWASTAHLDAKKQYDEAKKEYDQL